jgi:ribA/ribD-fused uncharacterized protein
MGTKDVQNLSSITKFEGEYRFLSNFWNSELYYQGITYPTLEHAYQAAKTLNQQDRERISKLETPGTAKRAGRELTIQANWDILRVDIMRDLLLMKFTIPELRKKLIATGTAILVEGNTWHDNYWGSCTCIKCKNQGRNILGTLLMSLRSLIQGGVL